MELLTVNKGIIKQSVIVSLNDKGEVKMSDKNKYIYTLIKKGLDLKKIGYNFVIDTKFTDKILILANDTEKKCSRYDDVSFHILEKELNNELLKINLFLTDRKLWVRHNSKNQLILQLYNAASNLSQVFIRDKSTQCISVIEYTDIVTGENMTVENKLKKGMFLYTTDSNNGFFEQSQKFITDYKKELELIDTVIPNFIDSMRTLEEKGISTENKNVDIA